jgi:DNA polymerase I
MEAYARQDARITWDLFAKFYPRLSQDPRAASLYELERQVMPVLIQAEATGLALDAEKVTALHAQYTKLERELHTRLEEALGEEALGGAGSEEALLDALLSQGVTLTRKTPTGQLATNHFALQEHEDEFPVLADLMEWRRCRKFLSTYLGPALGRTVVHTSFLQMEARTGRMSSRRPNLQNVPKASGKEVREIFVPRPGCCFAVLDFDSIEPRLLAYYLGTHGAEYAQMIEDGHDQYAWLAAEVWGGTIEDYVKGSPGEAQRSVAKNVQLAVTYGAGAPRISDMLKITPPEARVLISKVKGALPGYHQLTRDRIKPKIEATGHLHTLLGRKQVITRDKSYLALNSLIQGSAADVFKQAVVNVAEAWKPIGWQPILFVHDEIVGEGPTQSAADAEKRARAAMVSAADFRPRLAVSSSIVTTNYGDA